ncbi:hypothetical protein AHiyo4_07700 [Arthrobacter sp. Hiyo4]|nr:hypothetical protein AHiyo4_07700 [Arthrobacter sp. Hiyo4]
MRYVPTRRDFDLAIDVVMAVARFEDPKIEFKPHAFSQLAQAVEKLRRYRDFMTEPHEGSHLVQERPPRRPGGTTEGPGMSAGDVNVLLDAVALVRAVASDPAGASSALQAMDAAELRSLAYQLAKLPPMALHMMTGGVSEEEILNWCDGFAIVLREQAGPSGQPTEPPC